MRPRGPPGPFFRAPTFQHHPRHLIYSLEGARHHLHEDNLAGAISSRIPNGLRPEWWNIVRGRTRDGAEA
eukprot:10717974-Alexandrium_andersonii.AAC.1